MRRNNSEGRSGGREDSSRHIGSDKKKSYGSREDKPATGFKKYREADKSEAGWTKADGKPIRKRVSKKREKSFSADKPRRKEEGFTENKTSSRSQEPRREKSFPG